jgi:hypothetical protein
MRGLSRRARASAGSSVRSCARTGITHSSLISAHISCHHTQPLTHPHHPSTPLALAGSSSCSPNASIVVRRVQRLNTQSLTRAVKHIYTESQQRLQAYIYSIVVGAVPPRHLDQEIECGEGFEGDPGLPGGGHFVLIPIHAEYFYGGAVLVLVLALAT